MRHGLLIGILLVTGCARHDHKQPDQITAIPGKPSQPSPMVSHWFILKGQSNMVGQGMKDAPFAAIPGVTMHNGALIGPGYAFGAAYVRNKPGTSIDLIQCAVGGTSLAEWAPGGSLDNACLDKWRALGSPKISGILFMQGEDEGAKANFPAALNWAQTFTTYVPQWRAALGNSDIPLVFAQIGPNPGDPSLTTGVSGAWTLVQNQQTSVFISSVSMVTSNDLTLSDGWLHFDKPSYAILGERMYVKYSELAGI